MLASNYSALKQGLLPQDPDDDLEEAEDKNLNGDVNEHPPSKSNELVKKNVCLHIAVPVQAILNSIRKLVLTL